MMSHDVDNSLLNHFLLFTTISNVEVSSHCHILTVVFIISSVPDKLKSVKRQEDKTSHKLTKAENQ